MLADQYDLPLSTASTTARDAYVQGCHLLLTLYPGAADAFDRAIEADPGFALAHAAKALARFMAGDIPAAQAAIANANALSAGLPARETSHLAFFDRLIAGQTEAALDAGRAHLETWPRDRMVANMCGSFAGLLTFSGRVSRSEELLALLTRLVPHYGDDWWFTTHHAMALIEAGQRTAARPMIERALGQNPQNAWAAHTFAHYCYEDGDPHTARAFLTTWLPTYPKTAPFHGHLSWHLALGELEAGNANAALSLYHQALALDAHSGPPRGKLSDGASFLWRWELAGHPRDPAAWQAMLDFINETFPRAGLGFADMHIALAQAVAGDGAAIEARIRQMEDLLREGRYATGPVVPALARAFAAFQRQDFAAAIAAIEPIMDQRYRVGGSRAQVDLLEFTLLRAYTASGRTDDVRRMLGARRPGPSGIPVVGLAAIH